MFIAVGTPSRRGDGHADRHVYEALREIAPLLSGTAVVITIDGSVGTGDGDRHILREMRQDAEIQVASNPESLREGAAIKDFNIPTTSWSAPLMRARGHYWQRYINRFT